MKEETFRVHDREGTMKVLRVAGGQKLNIKGLGTIVGKSVGKELEGRRFAELPRLLKHLPNGWIEGIKINWDAKI